ncbi:hypothetical protein AQUCO_02000273v1 [Aquilegia coerulea]|uniref:KIB1-4 beta-propeller domain-containing protein n=1 Tax=Aquilegia coerulea TaxID=218851 RepID=A0A2G5DGS6_AQUCA|nr:hypothetical protein AQUCO_02000273v1 [Aquilegia coerulea]
MYRSFFKDVIYFNKTQQFYAVLQDGAVLSVDLIREGEGEGGQSIIIPKLTQIAPPTHEFEAYRQRYLVETSSGELLQVCKILRRRYNQTLANIDKTTNLDEYVEIVKFEVFKLDPVIVEWSRIHDMGDTILFLGDNSSISGSASEFPGCKPNCIYYTDDGYRIEVRAGSLYNPHDMGIYNLADGTHQPHYPTASRINFPAPIWLEPTLQRCSHLRYLNEDSNTHHCLSTTLCFELNYLDR